MCRPREALFVPEAGYCHRLLFCGEHVATPAGSNPQTVHGALRSGEVQARKILAMRR